MNSIFYRIIALTLVAICLPGMARAQTSFDAGGANGGGIIVGWSNSTCDSSIAGAVRYNSSTGIEFCNGSAWTGFGGGGGLTGPSGCANIGDLCADGTVFAGWDPVREQPLYIPPTDQSSSAVWKTSTGTDDIATDSISDGQVNQSQVSPIGSGTFPAFDACYNLTFGGHSDWYLPSQIEMYYVWAMSATIEAAGNITNFGTTYWTSTECSTNCVWYQNFASGIANHNTKSTSLNVRCVRR